jgi:RNA polymerase sigma-70 factor (ECF subfamily)
MSVKQHQLEAYDAGRGFHEVHEKYRERLINSMTAIVRDRDTAEDITATAFATAFEKLESFRGESSLYTWVYSIALNAVRRQRSKKSAISLDALESAPPELATHDHWDDFQDRSAQTLKSRKALGAIPPAHRRVLVDHFIHGRPVKAIARRERIPVGTVLSRIFTAKRRLREAWN